MVHVGEGAHDEGVRAGTNEVLLTNDAIVAPLHGKEPTPENVIAALMEQMHKTMPMGMAEGGRVSPGKARKIMHDGEVRGHPLTDKQRRFFGAMMHEAADGLWSISNPFASRRRRYGNEDERRAPAAPAPVPAPTPAPVPQAPAPVPVPAGLDSGFTPPAAIADQGVNTILEGVSGQFGRDLFDPLATGARTSAFFKKRRPTIADINSLSNTQAEALKSALSTDAIDPQDFLLNLQREFQGWNPGVGVGEIARVRGFMN